ncbi:uncharacterized protein LOC135323177 [Camelus dromedarius]|uniref:uncharacterized protein LOC135323177 n=1 Tax=Camelus dromedarius TaxID=9838 RepID=UPI00311A12D6
MAVESVEEGRGAGEGCSRARSRQPGRSLGSPRPPGRRARALCGVEALAKCRSGDPRGQAWRVVIWAPPCGVLSWFSFSGWFVRGPQKRHGDWLHQHHQGPIPSPESEPLGKTQEAVFLMMEFFPSLTASPPALIEHVFFSWVFYRIMSLFEDSCPASFGLSQDTCFPCSTSESSRPTCLGQMKKTREAPQVLDAGESQRRERKKPAASPHA